MRRRGHLAWVIALHALVLGWSGIVAAQRAPRPKDVRVPTKTTKVAPTGAAPSAGAAPPPTTAPPPSTGATTTAAPASAGTTPPVTPTAPPRRQSRVAVAVTDIADGRAYVEPGSEHGLRPGDEVEFTGRKHRIIAVSKTSAVVDIGDRALDVGARGTALTSPDRSSDAELRLPKPTELAVFQNDWPPAPMPSNDQHPRRVPLGETAETARSRAIFSASALGVAPLSGKGTGELATELRSRVHYEPFVGRPFSVDLDAAVRGYFGPDIGSRDGSAARRLLRVRELSLAYGTTTAWRGLLGRLRYGSAITGHLDGGRVEAPLGTDFRLVAFGGMVPEPLSGAPSGQAARFGSEFVWQQRSSAWRPRALIGTQASRFDGALDERKAYALVDLFPGATHLGAHTEVSVFDQNNPWNARPVELTAAGADVSIDTGTLRIGARGDLRRPDRSRWLATFLPPEWLCRTAFQSPLQPVCRGNDAAYWATIDSSVRLGKVILSATGQSSYTEGTEATNHGVFGNFRWMDVVGRLRVDAGATATTGSFLRTYAASLSPGLAFLGDRADVSVRYRPAVIRERASSDSFVEHMIGGSFWFAPSRLLDFTLQGDVLRSRDINVLLVLAVARFHMGL